MLNESEARQELSDLYAAMVYYKWDDLIYTHASVRVPNSNKFLINRFGMLFQEVTADNLIAVDIDAVDPEAINLAGHTIHSAIYRNRPDVNCIIHTHTVEGVAVSASTEGLVPISQYSCGVIGSLAYHDYQGILIDRAEEEVLCKNLGSKSHMILRNHGLLTVGVNVLHAFFNMYNLQKSCEVQVLTPASSWNLIPVEDMLKTIPLRQAQFNQPVPHRLLAWSALKRLIGRA